MQACRSTHQVPIQCACPSKLASPHLHRVSSHASASTSQATRVNLPARGLCTSVCAQSAAGHSSPDSHAAAPAWHRCFAVSVACMNAAALLAGAPAAHAELILSTPTRSGEPLTSMPQPRGTCDPIMDVAGLFGSSFPEEKDPVNAFTLYGTVG